MSFIYLATPYSKYKAGLDEAFKMASRHAGQFIGLKFPVFCPIAHSHPISLYGGLAAKDHGIWMPLDFAFCDAAFALVVVTEDGWEESYGVQKEIEFFTELKKPIHYYNPIIPLHFDEELTSLLAAEWARWQSRKKNVRAG